MAYTYINGILLPTGTEIQGFTPIDRRFVVPTVEDLDEIFYLYDGLLTYVQDEKTYYNYDEEAEEWVVFSGGSGTGDYIPLAGTLPTGKVTGEIGIATSAIDAGINILTGMATNNNSFGIFINNTTNVLYANTSLTYTRLVLGVNGNLTLMSDAANSRGLISNIDHSANIQNLDYTQKIYVDTKLLTKISQNNAEIKATTTGTDTYVASLTPAITTYSDMSKYFIRFTTANTGASTLNINGLGAKAITVGGSALQAGIIDANISYMLIYNSITDSFRLTTSNKVNTQTTGDVSKNIANTEFVENALTDATSKKILLDTSDSTPITGVTTETLLKRFDVPANKLSYGALTMEVSFTFTSPQVASKVVKMYISNNATFTPPTTAATMIEQTFVSTSGGGTLQRTGKFKNAGWIVVHRATATPSSYLTNSAGFTGQIVDITQPVYIFFSITLSNAADSAFISYFKLTNDKL